MIAFTFKGQNYRSINDFLTRNRISHTRFYNLRRKYQGKKTQAQLLVMLWENSLPTNYYRRLFFQARWATTDFYLTIKGVPMQDTIIKKNIQQALDFYKNNEIQSEEEDDMRCHITFKTILETLAFIVDEMISLKLSKKETKNVKHA